jgi:hypothetical protein
MQAYAFTRQGAALKKCTVASVFNIVLFRLENPCA